MRGNQIIILAFLVPLVTNSAFGESNPTPIYLEVEVLENGWKFHPEIIFITSGVESEMVYNNTDDIPHDFNLEFGDKLFHFSVFPISIH